MISAGVPLSKEKTVAIYLQGITTGTFALLLVRSV